MGWSIQAPAKLKMSCSIQAPAKLKMGWSIQAPAQLKMGWSIQSPAKLKTILGSSTVTTKLGSSRNPINIPSYNKSTGFQYLRNFCWIPAAMNNHTGLQYQKNLRWIPAATETILDSSIAETPYMIVRSGEERI